MMRAMVRRVITLSGVPVAGILEAADEGLHRPSSHLVVRQGHGREPWAQSVGDQLLVVEADDGQVLRDAEATLGGGLVAEQQAHHDGGRHRDDARLANQLFASEVLPALVG